MNYAMKDFYADVIEQSFNKPVLVDFWAEWCEPCKVLGPVLEKLAEKYKDTWTLVKVNSDENPQIAAEYGIKGIPAVKLFYMGNVADEFTGALPEPLIEKWLKKVLPSKNQDKIEDAKKYIEEGNEKEAEDILKDILAEEPDNEAALINYAKILVFKESSRAAEIAEKLLGSADHSETAAAIQTFAELLKHDKDSLPEDEVKEEYSSAIEDLKNKNFDSALTKFINVIRNNKSYDNEGARRGCIAIFKYLGEEHPVTLKHRRDFGSALYI